MRVCACVYMHCTVLILCKVVTLLPLGGYPEEGLSDPMALGL